MIVMPIYRKLRIQIDGLVRDLIEFGLCDDQNAPFERQLSGDMVEITFSGYRHISSSIKDREYKDIYDQLKEERAYLVRMADGALVQIMYMFKEGDIQRHRLAFFPSPYLHEFQNEPEIYLEDEIYADILDRNIVPFPLRFDFDARDGVHEEVTHPMSHLTLGQYRNCRIPVTAPLMPYQFIEFILRNFYHTAHERYCDRLTVCSGVFDESIVVAERAIIHVHLPVAATS